MRRARFGPRSSCLSTSKTSRRQPTVCACKSGGARPIRTLAAAPTGPLCQPGCVELVHADPAQATALRDLHLITWEVTYRDRAREAWYRERLAAHAVRDWGEIVRSQAARGGGVLTAASDGRIVGLCQYGPTEDEDS